MPGEFSTTSTGDGALVRPAKLTRRELVPKGVLEGRMALIWLEETNIGIAETLMPPWVIVRLTPLKPGVSGNSLTVAGVVGPMFEPKIVKTLPRAIPALGRPGGAKLAALTTPR